MATGQPQRHGEGEGLPGWDSPAAPISQTSRLQPPRSALRLYGLALLRLPPVLTCGMVPVDHVQRDKLDKLETKCEPQRLHPPNAPAQTIQALLGLVAFLICLLARKPS